MLKTSLIAAAVMSFSVGAHARSSEFQSNIDKYGLNKHGNTYSDKDFYDNNLKGLAHANAKQSFCKRHPEDHRCDHDYNGISFKESMKFPVKPSAPEYVVVDGKAYPICSSSAVDPDGDRWGWENNQSCVVR